MDSSVVTDSCGDLRFVLRELAYCIEDDAVFSTNRLMSQFPVLKVLRAKFIECGLYCYHLSMSGWNLTENDSVEQRTWFGVTAVRLLLLLIEVMSTVGYNLPSCLPIYLRATYQRLKLRMELMRPFKMRYMCIWNQGLIRLSRRCLGIFGFFGSYFIWKWNQCLHNRLTTCAIWKANGGKRILVNQTSGLIIPQPAPLF
jgi:hypothetical protein